jgi:hypothetical protein
VLIWPSLAKLAVRVCYTGTKIIAILGKRGSNNTPQHPNTPFEQIKNLVLISFCANGQIQN